MEDASGKAELPDLRHLWLLSPHKLHLAELR